MSVLRIRVHDAAGQRDLAVDGELPLEVLAPHLATYTIASVLDGHRPLVVGKLGLRAQGLLDGADVRLVAAERP